MIKKIKKFFKDEEGATAVEYGIMVAAIAAVIIGVVVAVGTEISVTYWTNINTENWFILN